MLPVKGEIVMGKRKVEIALTNAGRIAQNAHLNAKEGAKSVEKGKSHLSDFGKKITKVVVAAVITLTAVLTTVGLVGCKEANKVDNTQNNTITTVATAEQTTQNVQDINGYEMKTEQQSVVEQTQTETKMTAQTSAAAEKQGDYREVTQTYRNGDEKVVSYYHNGELQKFERKYADGTLESVHNYKDGKDSSIQIYFGNDEKNADLRGKLSSETRYDENGKVCYEYYNRGYESATKIYSDGKLTSMEKYNRDGKLTYRFSEKNGHTAVEETVYGDKDQGQNWISSTRRSIDGEVIYKETVEENGSKTIIEKRNGYFYKTYEANKPASMKDIYQNKTINLGDNVVL